MIKTIHFENFKSFASGSIDLKPITILLGANNVGKSSIIQLILMIEQTANYYKKYNSALRLNGEYVKLGEAEKIFKDMKTDLPLTVEFELDGPIFEESLNEIARHVYEYVVEKFSILNRVRLFLKKAEIQDDLPFRQRKINSNRGSEILELIYNAKKLQSEVKSSLKHNPDDENNIQKFLIRTYGEKSNLNELINYNFVEASDIINLLIAFEANISSTLIISYSIIFSDKDNRLLVNKISVGSSAVNYLEYNYDGKHFLSSNIFSKDVLEKYRTSVGKKLKFSTIFELVPISDDEPMYWFTYRSILRKSMSLFSDTLHSLLQILLGRLRSSFNSEYINYVNPLRAFPKRYYFLDKSNISHSLNTIDGDNLTEVLKDDKIVRDKVNKWLSKFEIKITVNAVQDVIHQINVHQYGLSLDLTDVGFGISQVLPVIVQGFLSRENSLTIIEQPEIHLHPKMQADLADLFIDIIYPSKNEPNKFLLIETHSEYMLKRLRRRIAEKKLNYEDVAIYFIHPRNAQNNSAIIEKIIIDEYGVFKWPKEFYEDDLIDTVEFLKHQPVKS